MATGSQLSSLYVRIGADTTGLDQGIARAKGSLASFEKVATVAVTSMAAVAAGAAAAGAAITAMVASSAKTAREITNLSQVANTSATDFQGLAFAAKSVGIEQEKFADILKDVNDRIGDFRSTGGGPMLDFFEQIAPKVGITAEAFRDLSGPQALQLYYDSLVKAGAAQEDLTFYMEAMASDATALIPLLENGGEGFRRLVAQAEALGMVLSDVQRQNLIQFDQALTTIGGTIDGLKNQLSAALAPALTQVAGRLLNFVVEVRKGETAVDDLSGAAVSLGTSTELQDWVYTVGIGIARLADALVGIAKTVSSVHGSFKVVLADLDTFNAAAVSGLTSWINPKDAEKRRQELEDQLEKRNKTLADANARWVDLWNYKGNRFEEAWQNAFNGPVELPPLTVFGRNGGAGLPSGGQGDEAAEKEREAYMKQLQGRLEALQDALKTESELELEAFYERQELLAEAREGKLLSDAEYRQLEAEIAQQAQDNLTAIDEKAAKDRQKIAEQERAKRVAVMDGMLGNLASLMDSGNKKMFQIGKVAAISRALLSGYEAVTQAYRVGTEIGGPVLGAAFAATAAAATAAQIASIRNVQFGGGGSPSSGYSKPSDAVAGGPAQPAAQPARESPVVNITIGDGLYSGKAVRDLIAAINEEVGDGARLRVT